jgi:hypothetical protein
MMPADQTKQEYKRLRWAGRLALFDRSYALAEHHARAARELARAAELRHDEVTAADRVLVAALRASGEANALHEALAICDAGLERFFDKSDARYTYYVELGLTLARLDDPDAVLAFELVDGPTADHHLVAAAKLELARWFADDAEQATLVRWLEDAARLGRFEFSSRNPFCDGVVLLGHHLGLEAFATRYEALVQHTSTATKAAELDSEAMFAMHSALGHLRAGMFDDAELELRRCAALAHQRQRSVEPALHLLGPVLYAVGRGKEADVCDATSYSRARTPAQATSAPRTAHPRKPLAADLFSLRLRWQIKQIEEALFEADHGSALRLALDGWRMANRPARASLWERLHQLTAAASRAAGNLERSLAVIQHALKLESTRRSPAAEATYLLELGRTLAAFADRRAEADDALRRAEALDPPLAIAARVSLERARLQPPASIETARLLNTTREHLLRIPDPRLDDPEIHPFVLGVAFVARALRVPDVASPDALVDELVAGAIKESAAVALAMRGAAKALRDGQLQDAVRLLREAASATKISEHNDLFSRGERILAWARPARVLLAAALFAIGDYEGAEVSFGMAGR